MKVQVDIEYKLEGKSVAESRSSSFNIAVKPSDSLRSLQQRVLDIEPVPFTAQELQLEGKTLNEEQRIGDLGLQDGQKLCLVIHASEKIFLKQLGDLIKARPLSATELSLVYTHRFGATVQQALNILGIDEKFADFVKRQKAFTAEGNTGLLKLSETEQKVSKPGQGLQTIREGLEHAQAQVDTLQTFRVSVEVSFKTPSGQEAFTNVDLKINNAQTVQNICESAANEALIPFPAKALVFQGQSLDMGARLADVSIAEGAALLMEIEASPSHLVEQLWELLQGKSVSTTELADLYCYRYGAPVRRALKLLGLNETLKDFLKRQSCFSVQSGSICATDVKPPVCNDEQLQQNVQYLNLHKELTSCSSIQKASRALDVVVKAACEGSFLQIQRVIRGGSIGRGTAVPGCTDAKAMLLLTGVPCLGHAKWAPPLLQLLAAMLHIKLAASDSSFEEVAVVDGAVHVTFKGETTVSLELEAADAPDAIFADRRARFFDRQPASVKVTMKLMKWWRNQQQWEDDSSIPSDEILEYICAFAAYGQLPENQFTAVGQVMTLLADFKKLCVIWPDGVASYRPELIPRPVLIERPLLLDPTDPEANICNLPEEEEAFDYTQLARLASNFKVLC
jgi:hypothetical protein